MPDWQSWQVACLWFRAGFKSFAIFCFLFRTFCAKRFREEMIIAHILLYGKIERNYSEQAVFKSLKEVTNNSKYKNPKTRRESGKICNIFFIAQSIYFSFYLVLDWYYIFRNTSQVSSTGRRPWRIHDDLSSSGMYSRYTNSPSLMLSSRYTDRPSLMLSCRYTDSP